jgi:DNA polymerase-3 subunit alpha
MWNANQKTLATMFSMNDVDKRKFVKQDFLGLANLDVLAEWKKLVKPTLGEIDWGEVKKEVEADPDHKMWRLFEKGLTLGLFQIEDGYARHLCKEFKPRSIEDLGVIVALNRPGPIRSGAPDSFIKRRNGEEDVTFDHPILEDILGDTYGWFLYQEQIIRFFSKLGLSEADADAVRKILGKKKPEDMRALYNGTGEWKGKGYQKLAEASGVDEEARETIWAKIEDFAKYSFNKSHAIGYATLCFRTAYAKDADTPHFVISCIRVATNQKKSKDQIGRYVSESRRMAIQVNLPNISKSQDVISYVDGEIYYGFTDIKGIGKTPAKYICDLRDNFPIKGVDDLLVAIEVCQEGWEEDKALAKEMGTVFKKKSPRQTLPQNRIPPLEEVGAFDDYYDRGLSMIQRQEYEKELLGLIITDDSEEILEQNAELLADLDDYSVIEEEGSGIVPGIVSSVVPKKTRKDGKAMGIVTIEYQGQQIEFVVFPQDWKTYRFLWKERSVAIFSLEAGDRGIRFKDGQRLTKDD